MDLGDAATQRPRALMKLEDVADPLGADAGDDAGQVRVQVAVAEEAQRGADHLPVAVCTSDVVPGVSERPQRGHRHDFSGFVGLPDLDPERDRRLEAFEVGQLGYLDAGSGGCAEEGVVGGHGPECRDRMPAATMVAKGSCESVEKWMPSRSARAVSAASRKSRPRACATARNSPASARDFSAAA